MATNKLKITYNGQSIVDADISSATTKTLLTSGKLMEGNVVVEAEGGSGSSNKFGYIVDNGNLRFEPNIAIEDDTITSIGDYALYYAWYGKTPVSELPTKFVVPNLTTVGNQALYYAFRGDTNLSEIDISSVSSIGNYGFNYAFYDCDKISGDLVLTLDAFATYGLSYAFYGTSLDRVLIQCSEEEGNSWSGTYGMQYCFNSTPIKYANVQLPFYSYTFSYAFGSCNQLEYLTIRNCFSGASTAISFGSYTLTYACSSASKLRFAETLPHRKVETVSGTTSTANYWAQRAFSGCTSLQRVDMSYVSLTQACMTYVCYNCQNLKTFTIRAGRRRYDTVSNNVANVTTLFYVGFGHDTSHTPAVLPKVILNDVKSMGAASSTTATTCLFGGTSSYRVEIGGLYLPHYRTEQTGTGKNNWFNQYSTCQEFHFSRGYENDIKALSGYATLWGLGAGAASVYFDLTSEIYPTNETTHAYIKRAQFETCVEITYGGTTYQRNASLDYWGGQFRAYSNGNDVVYVPCEYPKAEDDVLSINTETGAYTRLGAISSTKTYYCWTYYQGANLYDEIYTLEENPTGGETTYKRNNDGTFTAQSTVSVAK